jgi:hypothetical protein
MSPACIEPRDQVGAPSGDAVSSTICLYVLDELAIPSLVLWERVDTSIGRPSCLIGRPSCLIGRPSCLIGRPSKQEKEEQVIQKKILLNVGGPR